MLSGIQFHIIFQKIFLIYTIYLEILLLGIYSKDIECAMFHWPYEILEKFNDNMSCILNTELLKIMKELKRGKMFIILY